MQNYNIWVRNTLYKHIQFYLDRGFTVYQAACEYANVLYSIENSKNVYELFYKEYLIYIMYLDAYKINSYKQKECIANDDEIDFLDQLCCIEDSTDLETEVSFDPSFLVKMIEHCYQFHEMNGLGKVNLIKTLNFSESCWLEERFPMHCYDLQTYDIKITLHHCLLNMKAQVKHQSNEMLIDFKEGIMESIVGFVRNYIKNDYENAMDLIIEIAVSDYMSSKLLLSESTDNYILMNHIDLYENYSRNDILNELIGNQVFLLDAIWTIASVYVYKEYEGIYVDQEKLNGDYEKKLMKKLKSQ